MIYLAGNFVAMRRGHLQIVFGNVEIEVQMPLAFPVGADWVYEYRSHDGVTDGDPHTYGNVNGVIDPYFYTSTAINIGDRDPASLWMLLREIQVQFSLQTSIDYDLFSQNSNSFINTILYMVGIDVSVYLPSLNFSWGSPTYTASDVNVILDETASPGFILTLTSSDDIMRTGAGNDVIIGGEGNDLISTFSGDDSVFGGNGSDTIISGEGSDQINGGLGFDLVDYSASEQPIVVNLATGMASGGHAEGDTLTYMEAVLGTSGDDTFTSSGTQVEIFSGGSGADVFNILSSNNGPAIIWSGSGDDNIFIDTQGSEDWRQGILVVDVEGLTESNFHLFDIESLNLGSDFNWQLIDLVILNPDSNDRFYIDGQVINVVSGDPLGGAIGEYSLGIVAERSFSELNYAGEIIAPFADLFFTLGATHTLFTDGNDQVYLDVEWYPVDGGWQIEVSYPDLTGNIVSLGNYTLTEANATNSYPSAEHPGGTTLEWYFGDIYLESPDPQGWFIVGGSISGSEISSGNITYSMPDFELGGIPGGDSQNNESNGGGPVGGSYGSASNAANMSSGSGTMRLAGFNQNIQTLVVNGVALSATSLTVGMIANEVNGNTVIQYGEDDFVVLRGVSLTDWQAGSAAQILGGVDNDSLSGTSSADVIASGGGNDTITAAAGNDRINYTSGDDVIMGDKGNAGQDMLDLSRFNATNVSFSVSGYNVLIATQDGTIQLHYQVRSDLGNAWSNIEAILFADGTLDEAGIRARAIADQGTAGSDSISGTAFSDTIDGGAGNDTITAGAGNDLIFYSSGDDVIMGDKNNEGQDTLDLSQYNGSDVTFSVLGHDIIATTLDGSIRLHYQIRSDIGNAKSNIEMILLADGTLDEAGIRARAIADQGTAGSDSITGTAFNDVIDGGAGNDTLRGNAGADDFVFASGDNQDRIVDFALAADQLRFEGLTMANLTVTQVSSNTVISYGAGDSVTLVGILASNLQAQHYDFV